MFALTDDDLKSKIVGCGDGPASFNREGNEDGVRVVSVDPLYETRADFSTMTVLIARRSGRIIGSVRASLWGGACYIGRLIVHPDEQGKGIGYRTFRTETLSPKVTLVFMEKRGGKH